MYVRVCVRVYVCMCVCAHPKVGREEVAGLFSLSHTATPGGGHARHIPSEAEVWQDADRDTLLLEFAGRSTAGEVPEGGGHALGGGGGTERRLRGRWGDKDKEHEQEGPSADKLACMPIDADREISRGLQLIRLQEGP